MWTTKLFLFISLILVQCYALPTKNLEDTQNVIVSINAKNEDLVDDHEASFESRHPVIQNKPRILVSYGNGYKRTPVDPVQNLLMYFLMNVARDFAQDQEQLERRRSPNLLSNTKSALTVATDKIVTGSKKIGQKVADAYKVISSRDIPIESQYEETHYYPHIDGSCMCFNRLISRGSLELKKDNVKENAVDNKIMESEASTEKRIKYFTDALLKNEKTTELKMENHNVPGMKEKSTISVDNNRIIKDTNNTVRVLKVLDLDSLEENSKAVLDTSTTQKQSINEGEEATDLKMASEDNMKRNIRIETSLSSLNAQINLTKMELQQNKSNEDFAYYFLLSSGGTDKRTTARASNSELKHYRNLLPKYEDKLPELMKVKRMRRRRAKRHHNKLMHTKFFLENDNHNKKIQFLEERYRKRVKRRGWRANDMLSEYKVQNKKTKMPDIPVLMLPDAYERRHDTVSDLQPKKGIDVGNPPSQQKLLLTVSLPTFLGGGVAMLSLCYFLRAKGWCCRLFMDKSNIVVLDANAEDAKRNTQTQ